MKLRRFYLTLLLLTVICFGFSITAKALDPETAYQRVKGSYLALQSSAKKQLYRENWLEVIEGFVGVAQTWPEHRRAPDALYMAGKTARKLYRVSRLRDDADMALRYFNRIVVEYPQDSLADDALFQAGETLQKDLEDLAGAYRSFARIVREYPKGDMFALAKPRLSALAKKVPKAVRLSSTGVHGQTILQNVRQWNDGERTRIVLDFNGKVDFETHSLKAGRRNAPKIFFDMPDTVLSPDLATPVLFEKGLVERVRIGHPTDGTLRVVLDLRHSVHQRIFSLEEPFRIVADLTPAAETDVSMPATGSQGDSGGDELAKILEQQSDQPGVNLNIPEKKGREGLRRIVVDAGHGGKDPGAIGPGGTREKDVTLAMARKLARHLRSKLGCEVILTRDRDVYLPLEERTAIANRLEADLFISLHANASRNRRAYGIETYYLNFSKNKAAVEVAARENNTSLEEVGDLELILLDLMANAKINESSRLATEVQGALVGGLKKRYSRVRNLGVRPGPFYVLLGATMPSILVETAFISNPTEEKRLKSSSYQEHAARAIAEGVHRYARALGMIASNR